MLMETSHFAKSKSAAFALILAANFKTAMAVEGTPAKRARTMAVPRSSWVEVPADSDFTIHNIPFGVGSTTANSKPRVFTAIGSHVRYSLSVAPLG